MPKVRFYAVWKGRQTGIFDSWEKCAAQVNGFPGAEFLSFESRAAAEAALRFPSRQAYQQSRLSQPALLVTPPIADSYCVDAACSGNPGVLEYRGLHTTTRQQLFHQGPFENGTNNVGEFLAIVHALALLQKQGKTQPVYSDSENAIQWVKEKTCKTRLVRNERNAVLFELITRAENWLRTNEFTNSLLKWDTENWGEIPADFGRK